MPPIQRTVHAVYSALADCYGRPDATHPSGTPLNVLVETILSQHTSDKNSHRAFLALRRAFPRWEQVLAAPVQQVAHAIRSGGLANQKAPRIQAVLQEIMQREGRLSLARLRQLSTEEIYTYLTSLPGVGDKTACCVLLFALNRPAMPVDTHIHRIIRRLGWVSPKASVTAVRVLLESRLPPAALYHMHVLLIAHGRQSCVAQRPRCSTCPIRARCAYARSAKTASFGRR